MKRLGYHCTTAYVSEVKPTRMASVYLFNDIDSAEFYAKEFNRPVILLVEFDTKQVLRRWKASYGNVIRLKPGEAAVTVQPL